VRGYCGATLVGDYAKRTLRNDAGASFSTSCFRIRYPGEQVWENEPGYCKRADGNLRVWTEVRANSRLGVQRVAQELGG